MTTRGDRDAHIVALRQQGHTLDEIGREVNLTRERVRQIIKNRGGPTPKDYRDTKSAQTEAKRREIQNAIIEHLHSRGGATIQELAQLLHLPEADVSRNIPHNYKSRIIPEPRASNQSFTDNDMLELLREASTYAWPLTAKEYNQLIRDGTIVAPTSLAIMKRFGSWVGACDLAGVESGSPPTNRTYQSQWTDSELVEHVRDYLHSETSRGTYAGYESWRETEAEARPSGPTLRNQLGKWSDIKRRALLDRH